MLTIGEVLDGRYEIVAPIAEGGMGAVYRARRQMLGDEVAIKIVRPDAGSEPAPRERFLRESRACAQLRHPNIVSILDFNLDAAGRPFLVMELLSGPSLKEELARRGPLPLEELQHIMPPICAALQLAHSRGILHRDLKPANIVAHDFGGGARVHKIVDFGLASIRESTDATRLTGDHQFLGTVAYASPEQLTGATLEAHADTYSLAVVVYELLTGRHPFDSGPPTETRLHALGAEALPGLSRPQRKALRRAFSVERSARQQSAAQFLTEFNGTSTGKKVAQAGLGAAAMVPVMAFLVSTHETGAPEVAFEDLPAEVQTKFIDAMQEGDTAMTFGDAAVNDALHYYSEAYRLHAKDPRAIAGLEAV
ncbi:MAG TPA: serine/threonine-protein kinase, partial [Vicinamibacterales bacterium]|nr:serine/threonine-protein kinase [Vicinamibacterales bacterium]